MDFINPFIKVNAGGIPRLEAIGTNVADNGNVTYTFKSHRFLNYPYVGLLIFKLPAISMPATLGTVTFTSNENSGLVVSDMSGSNLESNNPTLADGGIFLGFYDNGKLYILNV